MVGRFGKETPGREPFHAGPGTPTPRTSRTAPGKADPPEDGRGWFEPPAHSAVAEPTQVLPVVATPEPRRLSPMVVARAVIVYQERPRRPWRLWVFTVALVALTIGVVLGQTVAFEPVYRPALDAQAVAVPSGVLPSGAVPSAPSPGPLDPRSAATANRLSAPLGAVRTRVLEVAGAATVLRVRSADLGEALFDIATTDPGVVPNLTDSAQGTRLEVVRTGDAGAAEVVVQLNAKVAWTLRLLGGASEQDIDLRAGGVAGIEVGGGTARVVLRLPEPKGTVPLSVTGAVGELVVTTESGTPVRFRLRGGAETVVVDGKTRRKLKAGAKVSSAGWSGAKKRYDVVTAEPVPSVVTTTGG